MQTVFETFKNLCKKGLVILSFVSLMFIINLAVPQDSYAKPEINKGTEEIVQPFELTKPAETRAEAYEQAAKLTENPKELIKAENREEKAEEKKVEADKSQQERDS